MKTILILGAGLSASSMIRYLLTHSEKENWKLRIVDRDLDRIWNLVGDHKNATALNFNATNSKERIPEIKAADIIISNRMSSELVGVEEKVFTRDLFGVDQ